MTATISKDELKVEHSVRPDVGREFLTIDIDGWDEVKRLTNKVLTFEGKKFTFSGWNSDDNKCYFAKPLDKDADVAKVGRK